MTTEDSVRSAFARARHRVALVRRIWPEARGLELYAVGSSRDPDTGYVVRVIDERTYACSCPAGESGRACCAHRAAVHLVRWRERAHAEQHARVAGLIDPPTGPRRLPPTDEAAWLDRQDAKQRAAMVALRELEEELSV